ncbi:Tom1 protein 2, partial [Globisporangium splendens]
MDAMEAKMLEWRKKMPSKRQLTTSIGKIVQQKSVAVLYTPSEQDRIKKMTDLIAKATSEYERGEHWDRIMAVVDALTNTSNRAVLKESVRFLRLRLGDPSSQVVILALTLTEAIVKNCGHLVHLEIASEPFMHELEATHKTHSNKRGRDSLEITARILEMVQAWGEAFLPYRNDYPLFIDTYHNMRKKGVKFPTQYDDTKVPVLTPPSVPSTTSISSTSSALAGLSPSELYHVATNVTEMFEDMLYEAQKSNSSISSHGVILELAAQARELVQRMEGVIQSAVVDGSDVRFHDLNSFTSPQTHNLHAALKKYEQVSAKLRSSNQDDHDEPSARASVSSRQSFQGRGDNQNGDNEDDDDPFAEFVRSRAGSTQTTSASTSTSAKTTKSAPPPQAVSNQDEDDEDDPFASFVQQRAAKIEDVFDDKKPAALAPVEKNLIDLWDDEPTPTQPQPQSQAPPAPMKDLWGDDSDFFSAPAVTAAPQQTRAPVAPAAPQKPLIDDLWGVSSNCLRVALLADDIFSAPPSNNVNSAPVAHASFPPPMNTIQTANPFDFMDFSQKVFILLS